MNRPPANIQLTISLIESLYNLNVLTIKELNGYDDRNYLIKTNDFKEFIVKITNSDESKETGVLDSINSLILHLYNNGLRVPVPQINNEGTYLTFQRIPNPNEESKQLADEPLFGFRLLDYIPGKLLVNVNFTPAILRECGEFLAKMTIALETFENQFLLNRIPVWSLLNLSKIREYMEAVDDPFHRLIVNQCLDEFERDVMSRLEEFEYNLIHGDYNEQNIIVDTNCQSQSTSHDDYHVKGVIDFSDVHFAPKVFDLAIYLAYSMLEFKAGPQILAPGFGLLGYIKYKTLSQKELNVLYVCIKARLCQSLVMGAHTYRLDPTNIYVLSSAKNGWPALRELHQCNSTDILNKWLNIDKYFQ